jgi:hypothetical protein
MCYGSHCPYEIKGGPYVGECTLRGKELKEKCPTDQSPYVRLMEQNERLYDALDRIGDLVGIYLPSKVHEEMCRLINDCQLSDEYRTRVEELEAELAALKDDDIPF